MKKLFTPLVITLVALSGIAIGRASKQTIPPMPSAVAFVPAPGLLRLTVQHLVLPDEVYVPAIIESNVGDWEVITVKADGSTNYNSMGPHSIIGAGFGFQGFPTDIGWVGTNALTIAKFLLNGSVDVRPPTTITAFVADYLTLTGLPSGVFSIVTSTNAKGPFNFFASYTNVSVVYITNTSPSFYCYARTN